MSKCIEPLFGTWQCASLGIGLALLLVDSLASQLPKLVQVTGFTIIAVLLADRILSRPQRWPS